jgi:hypothetical protein
MFTSRKFYSQFVVPFLGQLTYSFFTRDMEHIFGMK